MSGDYISEDEFWGEWGVIQKSDGVLFAHDAVRHHPLHHVWTIVESGSNENDNWYALPGFHYVNRMGYVLTQKRWSNGLRDATYFVYNYDFKEDDDA